MSSLDDGRASLYLACCCTVGWLVVQKSLTRKKVAGGNYLGVQTRGDRPGLGEIVAGGQGGDFVREERGVLFFRGVEVGRRNMEIVEKLRQSSLGPPLAY